MTLDKDPDHSWVNKLYLKNYILAKSEGYIFEVLSFIPECGYCLDYKGYMFQVDCDRVRPVYLND